LDDGALPEAQNRRFSPGDARAFKSDANECRKQQLSETSIVGVAKFD
jgi:hypothetical protein